MKIIAAGISFPDAFRASGSDRFYFNGQVSKRALSSEFVSFQYQGKDTEELVYALFGNMKEDATDDAGTSACVNAFAQIFDARRIDDNALEYALGQMDQRAKATPGGALSQSPVSVTSVSFFANRTATVAAAGDGAVLRIRNGMTDVLYGPDTMTAGIGEAAEGESLSPYLLTQEVEAGDIYIICTRPMTEAISPAAIARCVRDAGTSEAACEAIMEMAERKSVTGDLSIAVCMAQEEKKLGFLSAIPKKALIICSAVAGVILIAALVILLTFGGKKAISGDFIENFEDFKQMIVGDEIAMELTGDDAEYSVSFSQDGIVTYDPETGKLTAEEAGSVKITVTNKDGASVTKTILVSKLDETDAASGNVSVRSSAVSENIPKSDPVTEKTTTAAVTTKAVTETTVETTTEEEVVTTTEPETTTTMEPEDSDTGTASSDDTTSSIDNDNE